MDLLRTLGGDVQDLGIAGRPAAVRQPHAPGPFEVDGGRGQEHLAGEGAGAADAALLDRLAGGAARHLEAEIGGIQGIQGQIIDRAADGGAQALDGEAGQAMDAGFAGGEPAPVLRLALAEGGQDADARDGDRLACCAARHAILSIMAKASPR